MTHTETWQHHTHNRNTASRCAAFLFPIFKHILIYALKEIHTVAMSYYGYYQCDIDAMICSICGTAVFAWMAEVFACPVCGSSKYVFPMFVEPHLTRREDERVPEEEDKALDELIEEESAEKAHRKRKRVPSDSESS